MHYLETNRSKLYLLLIILSALIAAAGVMLADLAWPVRAGGLLAITAVCLASNSAHNSASLANHVSQSVPVQPSELSHFQRHCGLASGPPDTDAAMAASFCHRPAQNYYLARFAERFRLEAVAALVKAG